MSLIYNTDIKHGDNIIIYFSGHSSSYSCEEYCGHGVDNIEVLCPIDCIDGNSSPIPDISDREINIILKKIAHIKGYRITFILDCSHSGAMIHSNPQFSVKNIPPLSSTLFKCMLDTADDTARSFPEF